MGDGWWSCQHMSVGSLSICFTGKASRSRHLLRLNEFRELAGLDV